VIAELGWPLGTRAQMFWLEEGLPSSLVPGTRPRTTLSPSLALRDGKPYLAFGTPGGDQQDQWTLHTFLRHVAFGDDLQAAIDAPELPHRPLSVPPSTHGRPSLVHLRWSRGGEEPSPTTCATAATTSR
jgi:gamma-glutamyltranspeptidase/glutathione hydrolase